MYIIAEIGINFNNSIENCYKLIDAAAEAGCHAAKFQLFSAKYMYTKKSGKIDWGNSHGEYSYNIRQAVESFELPREWIDKLIAYCEYKNIEFLVSVFDTDSLDFVVDKKIKKIKLSSYTITHHPLIEAVAKTGVPIVMSSGGSMLGELEDAIRIVQKYHNNLTILHCSIQYPTSLGNANLGVLDTIKKAFPEVGIGYSDHTIEVSHAPMQAVYLGATVIEKHITLDKNMKGPDHFFALEPDELKKMVLDIKVAMGNLRDNNFQIDAEAYGSSSKICYEHEQYLRDFAYVSMFVNRNIKEGEKIESEYISMLRAGKQESGLHTKYMELFKEHNILAKEDIERDSPLKWSAIL